MEIAEARRRRFHRVLDGMRPFADEPSKPHGTTAVRIRPGLVPTLFEQDENRSRFTESSEVNGKPQTLMSPHSGILVVN
jgi:hypothetical protein